MGDELGFRSPVDFQMQRKGTGEPVLSRLRMDFMGGLHFCGPARARDFAPPVRPPCCHGSDLFFFPVPWNWDKAKRGRLIPVTFDISSISRPRIPTRFPALLIFARPSNHKGALFRGWDQQRLDTASAPSPMASVGQVPPGPDESKAGLVVGVTSVLQVFSLTLFVARIWTRVRPTFRLSLDDLLTALALVRKTPVLA